MMDSSPEHLRGSGTMVSESAPTAALLGCILVSVHLVLGGTASLALSGINPLAAWPYIVGFALAAAGTLLSASQPRTSKSHAVITVSAGALGVLTLPIAWLYFGFAGIGVETDAQVAGLLAAFIAAVVPLVMVFVGGLVSWRNAEWTRRTLLRLTTVLVFVAVAVSIGCIVLARVLVSGSGAS